MKYLFLSLTMIVSTYAFADSVERKVLNDFSFIPLTHKSQTVHELHYPGMVGDRRGNNPDCLVLLTENVINEAGELGKRLAEKLILVNGPGVLFNHLDFEKLRVEVINNQVVFKITDLGKYVTGVLIKTKSLKSFQSEINEIYQGKSGLVILQMSRGCKIASEF